MMDFCGDTVSQFTQKQNFRKEENNNEKSTFA